MPLVSHLVPYGEDRERVSCLDFGHVFLENPKIIACAVFAHDDRILLCRRAVEPRLGFWTLPAGNLELNESPAESPARKALEEDCANIALDGMLAIYSISRIAEVQIICRAGFAQPDALHFAAGDESIAVWLFGFDEIPPPRDRLPDRAPGNRRLLPDTRRAAAGTGRQSARRSAPRGYLVRNRTLLSMITRTRM